MANHNPFTPHWCVCVENVIVSVEKCICVAVCVCGCVCWMTVAVCVSRLLMTRQWRHTHTALAACIKRKMAVLSNFEISFWMHHVRRLLTNIAAFPRWIKMLTCLWRICLINERKEGHLMLLPTPQWLPGQLLNNSRGQRHLLIYLIMNVTLNNNIIHIYSSFIPLSILVTSSVLYSYLHW